MSQTELPQRLIEFVAKLKEMSQETHDIDLWTVADRTRAKTLKDVLDAFEETVMRDLLPLTK